MGWQAIEVGFRLFAAVIDTQVRLRLCLQWIGTVGMRDEGCPGSKTGALCGAFVSLC